MAAGNRFPAYATHAEVPCFNCMGALDPDSLIDAGWPNGQGRFRQTCNAPKPPSKAWTGCGKHTYYDLKEPPPYKV